MQLKPITMTPEASPILRRLDKGNTRYGAEVGVYRARTAEVLLRAMPHLTLVLVDHWCLSGEPSDPPGIYGPEAFEIALTRTEEFRKRRIICPMDQALAADLFRDHAFDFVHLDAGHSEADTTLAIEKWWPKVHPRGFLCGHDWGHVNPDPAGLVWGVKEAVLAARDRHCWHLEVEGASWFARCLHHPGDRRD